jgi:NitT/TauT family transport system substrate-binding protein
VRRRRVRISLVALALFALVAAACGDDSGEDTASEATSGSETTVAAGDGTAAPSGETLRVGYSAWPGWFPLAVADEMGFFEAAGLDVELTYFAAYTASLDALVAGELDINSQTLNDTIFAVSAGAEQQIFMVGDNSTGNDAVICDESITSVKDLAGKSIAAEAGVVDHFLLLQGLAEEGMTEADIEFSGLATDAAAAAFAGGEFDCVAVFAPFTVQALERPGSKVLFDSADFPGTIPDHFVATTDAITDKSADLQKFVEAWYATVEWMEANPDEALEILAKTAELTPEEYEDLAGGTTLFTPEQSLDAFADRDGDASSLPEMARRINPFLVSSGLAEEEADLTSLFDPSFTQAFVDGAK